MNRLKGWNDLQIALAEGDEANSNQVFGLGPSRALAEYVCCLKVRNALRLSALTCARCGVYIPHLPG